MNAAVEPSWLRRTLHWLKLQQLPLPRRLHASDPSLRVPDHLLKQRQADEKRVQEIQQELQKALTSASNRSKEENLRVIGALATKQYEMLYGVGATPQARNDFLARYGCTAWTEIVLERLVELGRGRGFVEMGAGHGQWARAISEKHQALAFNGGQHNKARLHDFVLAYDDASHLPLDPNVYHPRTQPHAAYFGSVAKCNSEPSITLCQWKNRNRILLLVYPTPELAIKSAEAYAAMGPENDTIVYVGEGRGGANADDRFFDLLQTSGEWVLLGIHPVQPFGPKGFEKLFIFQKLSAGGRQ